jgi:hypothetical protein
MAHNGPMAQPAQAPDLHVVPSTGSDPSPGYDRAWQIEDALDGLETAARGRLRGATLRGALGCLADARTRLDEVLDALGG